MNQKIHSIDTGSGIALFFQHGLTASVNQVESLLGGLPDIRLLSVDCPGHGLSKLHKGSEISFDRYANEVISLMDASEIEQGFFGGISMGSGIALNIALRYPERVRGLILVRPAWLAKGNPENLSILLDAIPYLGREEGQEEFERLQVFKNIKSKLPLAAKSVLGIFGNHQQESLSEVIQKMISDCPIPSFTALGNIDIPTLIIANDDDPLHPYDMAEMLNQNIDNSEIRKIVSGYIDKMQHRNDVRKLIQEFIKNITTIK